jgi:hypothetical protein
MAGLEISRFIDESLDNRCSAAQMLSCSACVNEPLKVPRPVASDVPAGSAAMGLAA